MLGSNLTQQLVKATGDPPTQHPAPVLRAPHQMQTQRAHTSQGATKPLTRHDPNLKQRHRQISPSHADHRCARFPGATKATGPLGAHRWSATLWAAVSP
ncbi:hypothetical protein I553_10797 [Mycobacterium xenopi 4042]|uniref:Uncharacterized protein n=1 Tax=Mycobacterium xenopi 4042 TaxID=1299334 RepID=X8DDC3_MYCXE|nr:hypothetical protein I553_10797 [Mycobacterium xenopi 4042]